VVQVMREPIKSKLASVTCALNLTGKYAVLIHGKPGIGISAKILDSDRRVYLREFFGQYAGEDYGFIVRTNAAFASKEEILEEYTKLKEEYFHLKKIAPHRTVFSCLRKNIPGYLHILQSANESQLESIITDDIELMERIRDYLENFQKEDIKKLIFYEDKLSIQEKVFQKNKYKNTI